MGGNAFQDLEKLTPEEYQQITKQLLNLITPLCIKMEPYIPFPEKKVHGDVDFLIILKPQFHLQNIVDLMKLSKEQYIINNNMTANTVYKKKQIDFNITADLHQFQMCKLYKSYGGIGAFLGLLLPSKLVKYSEAGIFCCRYFQHLKLEFDVSHDVKEILNFYGLNSQVYFNGFNSREKLFQFLLHTRFLNPEEFKSKKPKWTTKLINFFQIYLIDHPEISNPEFQKPEDPVQMTLEHFHKKEAFEEAWKEKVIFEEKKKDRSHKWNGKHIIDIFGVPKKEVNDLKKKFQASFGSKEAEEQFIDNHEFKQIVARFASVCSLAPQQ